MSTLANHHVRVSVLIVGSLLCLQLAACGSGSASLTPTGVPPSAPENSQDSSAAPSAAPTGVPAPELLLEVTSEGGFINPSANIGALPLVVVDSDGRIYTPGSSTAEGPAPLVAPVDVRDVGADGAAAILDAIRTAGLDREGSGGGVVADTGSAVFTVVIDGNTIVSRFANSGGPGLPGGAGGPGAPGSDGPGAAAFDLLGRLTDPTVSWGSAPASPVPYVPAGYRIYDAPVESATEDGGTPIPWPLPTDLASFGTPAVPDLGVPGLRSGIATGDAAATLTPVLASASVTTAFISSGQAYSLWVRPLFPDELAS